MGRRSSPLTKTKSSKTVRRKSACTRVGLEPTSLTRYEKCLKSAERAVISTSKKINFALSTMDASNWFES